MRIYRNAITSAKPLEVEEELSYKEGDFASSYPLLGLKGVKVSGQINRNDDFLTAHLHVIGTMVLSDAYTSFPFDEEFELDEIVDLLEDVDEDGDGYVLPGTFVELSEVVFHLIRSHVPLKPLKEGSTLPKGGEGYSVLTEEELLKKQESSGDPRFDILDGYEAD